MDKKTFLKTLSDGLIKYGIEDSTDITKDYENHFINELAKGKSEEEIASQLGDIKQIIKDYAQDHEKPKQKQIIILGLTIQDLILIPIMIMLYGLFIIFVVAEIACFTFGIDLVLGLKNFSFIPNLILPLSLLYGLSFISFTSFLFGLSMLYLDYINKVVRTSIMWQKSLLSEKYSYHENYISSINKKLLKKIIIYSGLVFLLLFISSYIISVMISDSFEFWHVWNWF